MIGIGIGISPGLMGGGSGIDVTEWPELKLWLKFDENTGLLLNDSSANPLSAGMTITNGGSHDPWIAPGVFETAASIDNAAFSVADASRPTINKLATPDDKAILIECYGTHAAYAIDSSEYPVTLADFSSTAYGYALRVRKSGTAYRVEMCVGGSTAQARVNASGNTTNMPVDTLSHIAAWCAGGASTDAGAAVNGTAQTVALSGAPGPINVATTDSTSLRLRIGTIAGIGSATDMYPGTIRMVRIWHFDTLPANIADIVAEMAADPLTLPPSLRRVYGATEGDGYSIGGGFSNS